MAGDEEILSILVFSYNDQKQSLHDDQFLIFPFLFLEIEEKINTLSFERLNDLFLPFQPAYTDKPTYPEDKTTGQTPLGTLNNNNKKVYIQFSTTTSAHPYMPHVCVKTGHNSKYCKYVQYVFTESTNWLSTKQKADALKHCASPGAMKTNEI